MKHLKKKTFAVHIHDQYATVIGLEKKSKTLTITEHKEVPSEELAQLLKKKKEIYCVIDTQDNINDIVDLQQSIKKDAIIKTLILKKLKDTIGKREVLINYKKIAHNTFDETVRYQVDGVYKEEFETKLQLIPDWEKLETITNDKFALLNITKQCYNYQKHGAFMVAYARGNKLLVLAADADGRLLFERIGILNETSKELLYSTIVNEISQTISYCKNQFRSVDFTTVLLSGAMTHSDTVAEQIFLTSNLNVAILYPQLFVRGLDPIAIQEVILALGALFTPKSEQFLPTKYLGLKQFKLASIGVYLLSAVLFGYTSFNVAKAYFNYKEALGIYEETKAKLIKMVQDTNNYSTKELQVFYNHLNIAQKYLYHHPLDTIIALQDVIKLIKPINIEYKINQDNQVQFSYTFLKKFFSLNELYTFKKEFEKAFMNDNKDNSMTIEDKTDYKKLEFHVNIIPTKQEQTQTTKQKRRRI